jgi:hypothetical protein
MRTIAAGIALAVSLSACGGGGEPKDGGAPAPTATKAPRVTQIEFGEKRKLSEKPLTEVQVAEYHGSVESAMDRIPPAMRADFQKAFECQAAKNGKLPPAQQIEMDGNWIVKKTEQLKVDRETALAC